jgi:hypothetical protein
MVLLARSSFKACKDSKSPVFSLEIGLSYPAVVVRKSGWNSHVTDQQAVRSHHFLMAHVSLPHLWLKAS